jgi:hypothetical protein
MPRDIVEKGVAVTVDFHSTLAPLGRKPRNRARTDIVAAREFGKRLALVAALDRLALSVIGEFERSAHFLPSRHGARSRP